MLALKELEEGHGRGWRVGSPSTGGEGSGVGALLLHPTQAHPKPTVIPSPEVKKEKSECSLFSRI